MTTRISITDGLPTRESGEWAKEKLYYVGRYMGIFSRGMQYKWPRRGYFDLMAGPGRCAIKNTQEEFDGSPVLAAQTDPPFERLVFIESDPESAQALEQRTMAHAPRRRVVTGDCNAPSSIAAIRTELAPALLVLGFVDMLGFNVRFDTIAAIVANRKVDLAITFQVGDLNRNLGDAMESAEGERLDLFFGAPHWRDVVRRYERGEIPRADQTTALADFYAERLGTIGYRHCEQLHRLMRNNQNAPLYRLLLACEHERGAEFFRKIAAIEHDGQRGFRFEG